jgi:hypothetical protein
MVRLRRALAAAFFTLRRAAVRCFWLATVVSCMPSEHSPNECGTPEFRPCRRDAPPETFEYNSRRLSRGVAACSLARDASWPYDGLVIIPMPFSNRVAAATKLRHELLRERKYLTSQLILRLSLQSIMGAMQQRRSNGFIFKRFLATVGPVKHIADEDVERCSPAAASQIRVRYPWANTI